MENVEYACAHRWVLVSSKPEIYFERVDGVTCQGETGNLAVTVVCTECERYKSFRSKPLEPGRG